MGDLTEREISREARRLCSPERQRREGRRMGWPCPMHGCRGCRLSAEIEHAGRETGREMARIIIGAIKEAKGRAALTDRGQGEGSDDA